MLTLRAYRNEDAEKIAAWLGDEQVFAWWSGGTLGAYPLDPQRLSDYYAPGIASGEWFPRVLEEDGKVCGQLLMRRKEEGRIHFGLIIVDSAARGKGLGYAMLSLALEYAFSIRGAKRVTLNVFADNAPAIRCYERLGFIRTAEFTAQIAGREARLFGYEKRPANA